MRLYNYMDEKDGSRQPEGLDSKSVFTLQVNPVYRQGMTREEFQAEQAATKRSAKIS
jgi:hypothetical protein